MNTSLKVGDKVTGFIYPGVDVIGTVVDVEDDGFYVVIENASGLKRRCIAQFCSKIESSDQ